MTITKEEFLSIGTVRTELVKLDCLANTNFKDKEFLLKEMNIAQNKEYKEILASTAKNDSYDECIEYGCKSVMVEPAFFTDEELKNMNGLGKAIMDEIFQKIPTIGMSAKEKKLYYAKLKEIAEKQIEEDEATTEKK